MKVKHPKGNPGRLVNVTFTFIWCPVFRWILSLKSIFCHIKVKKASVHFIIKHIFDRK